MYVSIDECIYIHTQKIGVYIHIHTRFRLGVMVLGLRFKVGLLRFEVGLLD